MGMLPIQVFQKTPCLLLPHSVMDFHCVAHPLFKGRRDVNTDMRDSVIRHNCITAAAHNDKVFFSGHIAQQVTLIKEYGIFLGKAVISAEFTHSLPKSQALCLFKCTGQIRIQIRIA